MGKIIELTDDISEEGYKRLRVGQVLMFKLEDAETNIRITRKAKGRIWGKIIPFYKPEEVKIVEKKP